MRLPCTLLSIALSLSACRSSTGPEGPPVGRVRVLLVGNSLTSTNDLPAIVAELGRVNGVVATRAFATRIRAVGATPATSVQGLLPTAGQAWLNAWRETPALELYGRDGFTVVPEATVLLLQRAAHDAMSPMAAAVSSTAVFTAASTEVFTALMPMRPVVANRMITC